MDDDEIQATSIRTGKFIFDMKKGAIYNGRSVVRLSWDDVERPNSTLLLKTECQYTGIKCIQNLALSTPKRNTFMIVINSSLLRENKELIIRAVDGEEYNIYDWIIYQQTALSLLGNENTYMQLVIFNPGSCKYEDIYIAPHTKHADSETDKCENKTGVKVNNVKFQSTGDNEYIVIVVKITRQEAEHWTVGVLI